MKRHFNTHLEGLDLQFWHYLIESRGKIVSLKKGEYLCRKGGPTNIFGYVKSGYLIYTFIDKNRIGGFAFKNALWGDYPNCFYNLPAVLDIVAGKKSEVWVMDAMVLPELFKEDMQVCQQGISFMERAYRSLLDRYCSLYSKTAKERYLELIHEHPQIEQDVPQKEIASYLQIDPITLCRIKKALLKQ